VPSTKPPESNFCHLHLHTEYSILDGVSKVEDVAKQAKKLGMRYCAITDHGVLHGIIEFYKACKKEGIKPILGCEAYVTDDPDFLTKEEMTRDNRHLVLLVQNETGLKNLIWLSNNAQFNNFYYKPRIFWEHLKARSEGLVAMSACLGGILGKGGEFNDQGIFSDPLKGAEVWGGRMIEAFGQNFYIEIQDHDIEQQRSFNQWAIKLAKRIQAPLVITSDCHYLTEEDKATHDLIMAQQMGMTLAELKEMNMRGNYERSDLSMRTPDSLYRSAVEMGAEEAFENTGKIADSCNVELKLGSYETPEFKVEDTNDYEAFLLWQKDKCSILDQPDEPA